MPSPPDTNPGAIILWLHAWEALHPGTGSVLSHIDLPIQREVHTGHPIVQSSTVKGALREHALPAGADKQKAFFGPDTGNASEHAGLGIFQEARIVLFPVRSMKGIFAWVTCPYAIARLHRDATAAFAPHALPKDFPKPVAHGPGWDQAIFTGSTCEFEEAIVLEDFQFTRYTPPTPLPNFGTFFASLIPDQWGKDKIATDIVVVHDDMFNHFLRHHTQITSHIKIENGVVSSTGPRFEESLPPETILYSTISVPRPIADFPATIFPAASDAVSYFSQIIADRPIAQIGGDRTTGRGIIRFAASTTPISGVQE